MGSTVTDLWISYLLSDFLMPVQQPISFWCDNRVALHITANPIFHEHTKHLDIDCYLVRDQSKKGFILPSHIRGLDQPADLFTKASPIPAFTRLLSKLGLSSQAPFCGGLMRLLPLYHCWWLPELQSATTIKKMMFVHWSLFNFLLQLIACFRSSISISCFTVFLLLIHRLVPILVVAYMASLLR
ncbi:UNVERIFIED_CONTAM: hypothetical protein Sradi_2058400 [Sesamum radiatum]|uniref:Copia protein n=1 Tax=Sesamum radiatum TaxID=300843 RepID=A0AAW2TKS7_SESRA